MSMQPVQFLPSDVVRATSSNKIPKALLPAIASGVRQTVLAAKTDSAGAPAFLSKDPINDPANITVQANYIENGNNGSSNGGSCFDRTTSTWGTSVTGASTSGTAYVGQNFGAGNAKNIRTWIHYNYSNANYCISSIKIQYSDNGSSWTDVGTYTLSAAASAVTRIALPDSGAHQYWRALANANPVTQWYVQEIVMSESTTLGIQIDLFASAAEPCVLSFSAGADSTGILEYIEPLVEDQLAAWAGSTYSTDIGLAVQAISGGDAGANVKGGAFDGGAGFWQSSQTGTGISGVAYIGQDFGIGVTKQVRKLTIVQSAGGATNSLSSVRAQYSLDMVNWVDIGTYTLSTAAGTTPEGLTTIGLPVYPAARGLRLLANANLASGQSWYVANISLHEVDTPGLDIGLPNYLYADRDTEGTITFGATTVAPVYQNNSTLGGTVTYSADLTTSAQAISGGDSSGYAASEAFDNLTADANDWASSQTGAGVNGVAYIGQDFGSGSEKEIRRIVTYGLIATGVYNVSSAKVQYAASQAGPWTDVGTYAMGTGAAATTTLDLPAVGAHRCWRLLANANNGTGNVWAFREIEMFELTTSTIPADQSTFDYTNYVMYNDAGQKVQRLFLGECAVDANGVITSVTPYALQGKYDSGAFSVAAATAYVKSHNLGCIPQIVCPLVHVGADSAPLPPQLWYNGALKGQFCLSSNAKATALRVQTTEIYESTASIVNITHAHLLVLRGW